MKFLVHKQADLTAVTNAVTQLMRVKTKTEEMDAAIVALINQIEPSAENKLPGFFYKFEIYNTEDLVNYLDKYLSQTIQAQNLVELLMRESVSK